MDFLRVCCKKVRRTFGYLAYYNTIHSGLQIQYQSKEVLVSDFKKPVVLCCIASTHNYSGSYEWELLCKDVKFPIITVGMGGPIVVSQLYQT